jgi:tRNA threonylcarbamoyladenosine biosynthesis protein TsaB
MRNAECGIVNAVVPPLLFQHSAFTIPHSLAFETSSAVGSVALGRGAEVLESRTLSRPKAHAQSAARPVSLVATWFLPTIKALCEAHQVEPTHIERVYVSVGPGSFTGLRMGVTAARMIALGVGARVVGVPTLEVIAQNALDADPPPSGVAVVLDAKRSRVYTAAFVRQGGAYVATSEAIEADPFEFLAAQPDDCAVLGEGILYHRSTIERSIRRILPESLYRPRAETVYRLGFDRAERGWFSDQRTLIPTYIRPPEAEEVWERKQSQGRT